MTTIVEHPEDLLKQYHRHVHRCTSCTYADMYAPGCTTGDTLFAIFDRARAEFFKRREEKGQET